jgi:CMP-N,N'-diacetyllegionaminic acid synthase
MILSTLGSKMNLLITLCARGGSKGIPGKNIRVINGRPLIALSIDAAKEFAAKYDADITLSTDSKDIIKIASELDLQTSYKRPSNLSTDRAGKIDTIADVLKYEEQNRGKKYDYILDLDITSPLRNFQDLESAFFILLKDDKALNLFSVNEANRNPYFNMVERYPNGYYGLVKVGNFLTRQSTPKVYDLNASFYFYRRSFFDTRYDTVITPFSLIYVMPHICFDLDHPIDFEFMEYLMINNKLGFEL